MGDPGNYHHGEDGALLVTGGDYNQSICLHPINSDLLFENLDHLWPHLNENSHRSGLL
jgi:hypothetical protein